MKLVYRKTGKEVQIGDVVVTRGGYEDRVENIHKPHKPSSTGRVYLAPVRGGMQRGVFPSVIDAEWINREDRV